MTNQEAIRKLQKQKAEYLEKWIDYSGVAEAFDMAIEALKAQRNKTDCKYCAYMNPQTCDCNNFNCENYKRRVK